MHHASTCGALNATRTTDADAHKDVSTPERSVGWVGLEGSRSAVAIPRPTGQTGAITRSRAELDRDSGIFTGCPPARAGLLLICYWISGVCCPLVSTPVLWM